MIIFYFNAHLRKAPVLFFVSAKWRGVCWAGADGISNGAQSHHKVKAEDLFRLRRLQGRNDALCQGAPHSFHVLVSEGLGLKS